MRYRIKAARKAQGLTLEQLAEKVGSSKSYISELERGARIGSVEMLRKITRALQISETEIFSPQTTADQTLLDHIKLYQQLSPEDRQQIDNLARRLQSPAA